MGNVLVTVSDRNAGVDANGNGIIDATEAYNADVVSAQDYYPFGMRIYDARIGKFLSGDPLQSKFAFYSPYQFAGNTPIHGNQWLKTSDETRTKSILPGKFYEMNVTDAAGDNYTVIRSETLQYNSVTHSIWPHSEFYYLNSGLNNTPGALTLLDRDGKFKGYLTPFDSQERTDAKAGEDFDKKVSTGLFASAVAITGGFAAEGLFAYGASDAGIVSLMHLQAQAHYYTVAAGTVGRMVAGFFDESGTNGMQESALEKWAFGAAGDAIKLAERVKGQHLMNVIGGWREEFEKLAGSSNTEFHFDITNMTKNLSSKYLDWLKGASSDQGLFHTEWEFNTLYNKYYEKFKTTIFYYRDSEGNETTATGDEVFKIVN